jgi:hypothetical protein
MYKEGRHQYAKSLGICLGHVVSRSIFTMSSPDYLIFRAWNRITPVSLRCDVNCASSCDLNGYSLGISALTLIKAAVLSLFSSSKLPLPCCSLFQLILSPRRASVANMPSHRSSPQHPSRRSGGRFLFRVSCVLILTVVDSRAAP